MIDVFEQTQLYEFLLYCESTGLEKTVLDCGAGGHCPPLAIFAQRGFKTFGIDFCDEAIDAANVFGKARGLELSISNADMRELPFDDESMSFVYSYNTIFHMTKADISKAMNEIKRVLKPNGLCYVNLLTTDDCGYGQGEELGKGEFLYRQGEYEILHTFYTPDESDKLVEDMELVHREIRTLERVFQGGFLKGKKIKQGFIDYVVKKK